MKTRATPRPAHRGRARGERGLSESLQWTVLTPLVMLCVLGIIQAGVMLHGRSTAASAALAGAEAQSVAGAGQGVGERVAREVAAGGGLQEVFVGVSEDGGNLVVSIDAHVSSFFPDGLTRVHARAEMPREAP